MTIFQLVQTSLEWQEPNMNREVLSRKLADISGDVVVLPEMFTTGFSMASDQLAESMDGETVNWMRDTAAAGGFAICGSTIIESDGNFYNRFLWVMPDGAVQTYDKRHLFRMANEDQHYTPGTTKTVIEFGGARLFPQICYDLRFPVWSRNVANYDVLICVANWPRLRQSQWLSLLKARAIENLCYVVAVNRVGVDGNNVDYGGGSCVIDYRGDVVADLGNGPMVMRFDMDLESLRNYRLTFPAHLDADAFTIVP